MKNPNSTKTYAAFAVLGFILFCAGVAFQIWPLGTEGIFVTSPSMLIGVGCGLMGGMTGAAIKYRDPAIYKKMKIEQKDERNELIRNKAKARVYDMMLIAQCAVIMIFALLNVGAAIVLVLTAVFVFFFLAQLYFIGRYNKEL